MNRVLKLCLLFGALVAAGCTGNSRPDRSIVSGAIRYKGQPVDRGIITFVNVAEPHRNGRSLIRPDGSYVITDAPIGICKVTIDASTVQDGLAAEKGIKPAPSPVPDSVNKTYSDLNQTKLTYEVKVGDQKKDFDYE